MILGIAIGFLASVIIKRLFNDDVLVVNTTFVSGFIAFFLAETYLSSYWFRVSGVTALVSLGCFMAAFGNSRINPEVYSTVH